MSKRRRLILRFAALGLGLCLSTLMAEVALRIWIQVDHPPFRELDDRLGWRLIPGARRTLANPDGLEIEILVNDEGLRGRSVSEAKTPGVRRVLMLGDSFTEATQVAEEDTFVARLRGPDREVLNAGVGAYGTVQQLLWLRDRGLAFDPDVVVVSVFENDLVDNCRTHSPLIGPRPYVAFPGEKPRLVEELTDEDWREFLPNVPFAAWLHRRSALFRSFEKNVWLSSASERLQQQDRAELATFPIEKQFAALFHALDEMRALCGDREFAIVLIPTREEAQSGESPTHQRIAAWAVEQGIPSLSLVPALHAASDSGERCYFETDIHWTAIGHRVVAERIATFLEGLR